MNRIYFIFLFLGVLFGCKKFDHEALSAQPPCDLCDFADSLNGAYRGKVVHNTLPDYLYNGTSFDSLTITVDHIFLNNDPYGDSLYMYFATSFALDSVSAIVYDTIQIRSASGEVYNSNRGDYTILPDSLTIYHTGSFQTGTTSSVPYIITYGTLYKQ